MWAVASVCAVIIVISFGLEKLLHKLGTWLTVRHKRALYEALEIVKAELMILGFISLILVFSRYHIAAICIPQRKKSLYARRIPAVGFPAWIPGHHIPSNSGQPVPVKSGSGSSRRSGRQRVGKRGDKKSGDGGS